MYDYYDLSNLFFQIKFNTFRTINMANIKIVTYWLYIKLISKSLQLEVLLIQKKFCIGICEIYHYQHNFNNIIIYYIV